MTAGPPARPGLRKAGDSDVHPSLPSVDSTEPSLLRPGNSTADAVLGADADKPEEQQAVRIARGQES